MHTALASTLLGTLLFTTAATAEQIYIYEEIDGTRWITNHKMQGPLAHRYKFVKLHGRPTASYSCKNMTPTKLAQRAIQYSDSIDAAAKNYGVSRHLIRAIIEVESCFDTKAKSRVGAQGLMQLMPATAEYLGVKDPFNGRENINGGVRYYSELQKRFNYNLKHAIAAYNAGPTAVEKYKGIPPYKETRNYVKKVMAKFKRFVADDS